LAKHTRLIVRAEIQFCQRLQLQIEQVERFLDESAFDELFSNDAAERFEVERLALREILDAPHELRRTPRDVLAAPGDFLVGWDALLRVLAGRRPGPAGFDFVVGNRPAARGAFAIEVFERLNFLRARLPL